MKNSLFFLILFSLFSLHTSAQSYAKKKKKEGKYGFVFGGDLVQDYVYDEAEKIEDFFLVSLDKSYGIVNWSGELVIPCEYDQLIYNYRNGSGFIAYKDGYAGAIDLNNNTIINFEYDEIEYFNQDSTGKVMKNGEWEFLRKGTMDCDGDKPLYLRAVEEMPRFPGCEETEGTLEDVQGCAQSLMLKYVYTCLKYPQEARKKGVEGTVVISFIVSELGYVEDAFIARDIGYGCGEEALSIIQSMPQWTPGIKDGKTVPVKFSLPVKFKLQNRP